MLTMLAAFFQLFPLRVLNNLAAWYPPVTLHTHTHRERAIHINTQCGRLIRHTWLGYTTKGVYREEGMQLTLFSESSNLVLIYF